MLLTKCCHEPVRERGIVGPAWLMGRRLRRCFGGVREALNAKALSGIRFIMMNTEMRSIRPLIYRYRECCRSLWNQYFRADFEAVRDESLCHSFRLLRENLFESLVVYKALGEVPADFYFGRPSALISVVSQKDMGGQVVPVVVSRLKKESEGEWDHPVEKIGAEARLQFVDLFDWNSEGYIDLSLLVAEIAAYEENPALVGHRLVIALKHVDVLIRSDSAVFFA